jgi:hypothetical protein
VDAAEIARQLGGTASHAQLVARCPRRALRRSVEAGLLRRVRRGVDARPDETQRIEKWALSGRPGGSDDFSMRSGQRRL